MAHSPEAPQMMGLDYPVIVHRWIAQLKDCKCVYSGSCKQKSIFNTQPTSNAIAYDSMSPWFRQAIY
jgi:hypothetical protein